MLELGPNDVAVITKQSTHYNSHIKHNIGTLCRVDEVSSEAAQVTVIGRTYFLGGRGAIDLGSLMRVDLDSLSPKELYNYEMM